MTYIKGQDDYTLDISRNSEDPDDLFIGIEDGLGDGLAIGVSARKVRAALDGYFPAEPRPVEVTDEMVERALMVNADLLPETVSKMITAAINQPPPRPEGAYELETVIGLNAGEWTSGPESVRALADLLASNGVRATGAE